MSEKKVTHHIPSGARSHDKSADCWCKPERIEDESRIVFLHDDEFPIIGESKDIAEVSAFFEKCTGQQPHAEMLKATLGSTVKVVTARLNQEIVGMAAYSMVMNPFVAGIGYALLVDLKNGYVLEVE